MGEGGALPQLSTFHFQFSTIFFPLSTFNFSISLFHKIQRLKVLNLYDSVQSVSVRFLDFYTRL